VFWNTCREDTCYYPTKVGNVLPWHETPGHYPHWAGRDLRNMLARGEDPLEAACDIAHDCGMKLYASYRRLTSRVAPHVFPLHPDAMHAHRQDLWCVDETGRPVPHLSLAQAEVQDRMIAILGEIAENYDIDGLQFFFARGVPFVLFEPPFVERFEAKHGRDPRTLPLDDRRVWAMRGDFMIEFLRKLRGRLDEIGKRRRRRFDIAMTVMNRIETCAYFGQDLPRMIGERLVDMLVPFPCHYLPPELGEFQVMPEFVAEIVKLARPAGVKVMSEAGYDYSDGKLPVWERAKEMYAAGADGLQVHQ
jgi:hypothetical protein